MPIDRILTELASHHWAMEEKTFRALLSVVNGHVLSTEEQAQMHVVNRVERLAMADYFGSEIDSTHYSSINRNVGFLSLYGPVIPRATWLSRASGSVSLDTATNEFLALEENPAVNTIVLLVDSPGGTVTGTSDFAALVRASEKTTIAYAWQAASAMYWISSAADKIIVPTTAVVGSIGALLKITDYSEADAKRGIKDVVIVSSRASKKAPDIKTIEGLEVYQKEADAIEDVFIKTVAEYRNTTVDDVVTNYGQGSVLLSEEALQIGMVDEIMHVHDFVNSVIESKRSVFMGRTKEGITMANPQNQNSVEAQTNEVAITAASLREKYPSLIAQIESEAVTKELNRVKEVEKLNELPTVAKAPQAVQSKVAAVINMHKYDALMTVADIKMMLADTVLEAQAAMLEEHIQQFAQSNKIAGHSATPSVDNDDDSDKTKEQKRIARIEQRRAERENENGVRS